MASKRSDNFYTIQKRNKKLLLEYVKAFPMDTDLSGISTSLFDTQLDCNTPTTSTPENFGISKDQHLNEINDECALLVSRSTVGNNGSNTSNNLNEDHNKEYDYNDDYGDYNDNDDNIDEDDDDDDGNINEDEDDDNNIDEDIDGNTDEDDDNNIDEDIDDYTDEDDDNNMDEGNDHKVRIEVADNNDNDEKMDTSDVESHNDFNVHLSGDLNIRISSNPDLTAKDHLLGILAMSIKDNSSYESILNHLKFLKISHIADCVPTTKSALWRALCRDDFNVTQHFYCEKCDFYLGEKTKNNLLTKECYCGAYGSFKTEENLGKFLELNLTSQIKQILSIPNIQKSLKYRTERKKMQANTIEDIYDGEEYKKLCHPSGFLYNENNFSLTFNTDGCKLTKSSNVSGRPIYAEINELPPNLRSKYMMLAGIYVNDKHPVMNNFFSPFVNTVRKLYRDGITWRTEKNVEITSKFVVVMSSVDLPARASILRMNQFNGSNSCIHCYAKGKSYSRGKYVFPSKENYGRLRQPKEILEDMKKATKTRTTINGMKGFSTLAGLPEFNINKGVVIEAMHAVYIGVVKQHTRLLLKTTNSPYYIGRPQTLVKIDNVLLKIRPPTCRSRVPRSITTWKQWKATEWKNWLGYAPICLKSVLNYKYVTHFSLLTEAIHDLNNKSITAEKIKRAEILLRKYTEDFEKYFGIENMSFNIHLLTHITDTVKDWGPIWAHSAFPFEAWNKRIIDSVTSPTHRVDQIATRFLINRYLRSVIYDELINIDMRNFIASMLNIRHYGENEKVLTEGKSIERPPSIIEKQLLILANYNPETMYCYKKIKINGKVYKTDETPTKKHNDSIVLDSDGEYKIIKNIVSFKWNNKDVILIFATKCNRIKLECDMKNIHQVILTNDLLIIRNFDKILPAIQIVEGDKTYVYEVSNDWEAD